MQRPATFQRLMEVVLSGLARDCCMVYLDDILVIGNTFEEHLENLNKVFRRLQEAGLYLKPKKCHLIQPVMEYLGYVVSAEGISADPKKVSILEFPVPTNLKSLKSFLGLASYYRRFVQDFSRIAQSLHALTRKGMPYIYDVKCLEAFDSLKTLLTDSTVLAFHDLQLNFVLETDASKLGLGAILSQNQPDGSQRPIAYASHSLQTHKQNYGITESEALGVVWAMKHFRPYLYCHRCTVITDHEALKSLLYTPQPSGKLARWGMALQELDLTIGCRTGRKYEKADALSQHPVSGENTVRSDSVPHAVIAATSFEPESQRSSSLKKQQRDNPFIVPFIRYMEDIALYLKKIRKPELSYLVSLIILYWTMSFTMWNRIRLCVSYLQKQIGRSFGKNSILVVVMVI